ncbi:hypothetical protein [Streptomyces sp. NPDC047525]|uniref:hypothetical protein n=1 Tax=Streptomyces sp. NPDC047525 TaxID=3155264 RepID=UPI0033EFC323
MSDSVEQPSLGSGYTTALESLRSTAKWLLTAFAGAGAALAAGLQLTGIGELSADSWRLWVALASAAVALAALGYMATSASSVLSQDWVTLGSFTDEDVDSLLHDEPDSRRRRHFGAVVRRLDENRLELYGHVATDLGALHRKLRETDDEINSPATEPARREAALLLADRLRATAREVVQCANYYWTLQLFRRMRVRLAWASLIAVLALSSYAYAANPPKPESPPVICVAN